MAGNVVRLFDRLANAITGAGTGRDPRTASTYILRPPLTQHEITAAYRSSGLLRKIIAIPALDMVREWRDWKAEDDQITAIEAEEKRLMLPQKLRQVETLRGLGGGALILGLPGMDTGQPAPATVGKAALAFVNVVSRWQLTFDKLDDDARSPGFGEPTMWQMQTQTGGQVDIHPSRVIPFRADTTSAMAMTMNMGSDADAFWGESTVAQVLDAVKDSDTARASFAALIHKARLTRIGIPGLGDHASTAEGLTRIQGRLSTIALAESVHNATLFDAGDGTEGSGEKITDAVYSFVGAKDILNAYAEFVAAISDIPATRLLGRAPEGMNSSGESQQRDWQKKIKAMQTLEMGPCMDRLDAFLIPSALGSRPEEVWSEWAPLDMPDQSQVATRFKTQMEATQIVANMGVVPDRALNRGVQSLLIDEGYLPELETALGEMSDDERYGIEPSGDADDLDNAAKGGDPVDLAGEGAQPDQLPPRRAANDAWMLGDWAAKSLYVRRDVLNRAEIVAWAEGQGFTDIVPDLHVTITYSTTPVDWMKMGESWRGKLEIEAGGPRLVEPLGPDGKYKALLFTAYELVSRNAEMREKGASFSWPEYQPHISIQIGGDVDLATVKPYTGKIVLGPEIFEEIRSEAV